ncbi:hypothetical protein RFI_15405 [Reticulomyxa filosa]|uniref:Uroporphyrinogen decarboxylase n=1 Tax=Reticulomyxa filosa TaxID=46433 RepID=X6N7S1_RETFI|nr:hypothetical protein RFI_15405 [Reticulomyxa filosa]|eukprot:ETO21799.1 hypothetical protein RFI_15405 [Reticulomyxa filosa]
MSALTELDKILALLEKKKPETQKCDVKKFDFSEAKNSSILDVAWGRKPQRIPVFLHRQAGRYMEEFRAIRQKHEFFECCQKPELCSEITLQPIEAFDLDAAIIFSDILVICQVLGFEVEMQKEIGPVIKNLLEPSRKAVEALRHLKEQRDVRKELGYVYEGIKATLSKLKGRVPLIGFVGGPWTLMSYVIAPHGDRECQNAKKWLCKYPDLVDDVLDIFAEAVTEHLIGQAQAGAQLLEIFESSAGYLSPPMFDRYLVPRLRTIYTRVRSSIDPKIPIIMFPRGAHFCLSSIIDIGFEVVALDTTMSRTEALKQSEGRVSLQGNLDPCILYGSDQDIEKAVFAMLDEFRVKQNNKSKLIVNLGHGMLPDMEPRAVRALLKAVRKYEQEMCL